MKCLDASQRCWVVTSKDTLNQTLRLQVLARDAGTNDVCFASNHSPGSEYIIVCNIYCKTTNDCTSYSVNVACLRVISRINSIEVITNANQTFLEVDIWMIGGLSTDLRNYGLDRTRHWYLQQANSGFIDIYSLCKRYLTYRQRGNLPIRHLI